jgi:hypothetical protein
VKEQNEKLGTVYINQANHQAKIEAELDQMKIMIRATGLFHQQQQIYQHSKPPIIDAQPKQSSAFFHPSQTQLHKPLVQQQQQQQQQHSTELHGLMRPMSCIDSINDYNRTNNYRYPMMYICSFLSANTNTNTFEKHKKIQIRVKTLQKMYFENTKTNTFQTLLIYI